MMLSHPSTEKITQLSFGQSKVSLIGTRTGRRNTVKAGRKHIIYHNVYSLYKQNQFKLVKSANVMA